MAPPFGGLRAAPRGNPIKGANGGDASLLRFVELKAGALSSDDWGDPAVPAGRISKV